MTNEAFFRPTEGGYQPLPPCVGPWNPESLHGRVVAGLLAHAIERAHGDEDFQPTRLTVDLYRLPDFSPVTVTTNRVRDGRRIRVVDAEFISGDVSVGRASCQLLRRGVQPSGNVWRREPWDAPKPGELEPPIEGDPLGGKWTTRPISGSLGSLGERRIWMSEVRELVDGQPLTPWTRVALAADFTSPFANAGERGLEFINSDITIYNFRPPVTEWIGFEVVNHQSRDGIAIAECYLHDEEGPIGSSSVCALAQQKPA